LYRLPLFSNAIALALPVETLENVTPEQPEKLANSADTVLQAAPLDLSLAPDLPEYARLTDAQIAAERQTGHWLDTFVSFASIASPMTPTAFHIAAGVFLGGLAIARRLFLDVSVAKHAIYPNLYMLYLGPSTVQRKSTALAVVRGLLEAAGLQHFLLADQQTPEALALDLTTRIPVTYDTWQTTVQERWLQGAPWPHNAGGCSKRRRSCWTASTAISPPGCCRWSWICTIVPTRR